MELATQQAAAFDAVMAFMKDKSRKEFKLFGFAGSGKTTLAAYIGEAVGSVVYVTFTGKAAHVLAQKGCEPASTIHRAIYKSYQDEKTGKWHFSLDRECALAAADLVIVDEGPMVGRRIAEDLIKVAKKLLILGDPFQLDPVKDDQYWGVGDPDFMLTEIHRQAADNPIIRLSMDIRERGMLKPGTYGDSVVGKHSKLFTSDMLHSHDQILCGKNDTRHHYNNAYRELLDYDDPVPNDGERLICLRNDYNIGTLNGSMWLTKGAATCDGNDVTYSVVPVEYPDQEPLQLITPAEYFYGDEMRLDWKIRKSVPEFCYGYVVTVHKFQGSQADSVLVFDQSKVFKESALKWLYTAVTRAADRVTVLV